VSAAVTLAKVETCLNGSRTGYKEMVWWCILAIATTDVLMNASAEGG